MSDTYAVDYMVTGGKFSVSDSIEVTTDKGGLGAYKIALFKATKKFKYQYPTIDNLEITLTIILK